MAATALPHSDIYYTIKTCTTGEYREKGSRFIAYTFPVDSEEEIQQQIADIRSRHHDARHHCFAWCLGPAREKSRFNDDGEPSGTAGRPIMGQILSFDITNVLVIVVRYFGGVLLGTGGLTMAYKSAARTALEKASKMEKIIGEGLHFQYSYESTRYVQRILKEEQVTIVSESFGDLCYCELLVPKSSIAKIKQRLGRISQLMIKDVP